MERRHFLKLGLAFAASGVLVAKTLSIAEAAPLPPAVGPLGGGQQDNAPQPAVADQSEVERLQPQEVRWHRRWGWRRRVWRRRRWHRPWGWHRRRLWRRRVWRRRYW